MKPGDLVIFSPTGKLVKGTLTAVKYAERMKKVTAGHTGVVIETHGTSCVVMFGQNVIVLHESFLGVINDS